MSDLLIAILIVSLADFVFLFIAYHFFFYKKYQKIEENTPGIPKIDIFPQFSGHFLLAVLLSIVTLELSPHITPWLSFISGYGYFYDPSAGAWVAMFMNIVALLFIFHFLFSIVLAYFSLHRLDNPSVKSWIAVSGAYKTALLLALFTNPLTYAGFMYIIKALVD